MTFAVLDLFSGIGGFSLGLERTGGFRTAAFCEIDPYCRRVLAKHWPGVPQYDDVRSLTAERLRADGVSVDVICGGFPCQDISIAGRGAGLAGERSGLWSEYARLVGELRPAYVLVENVAALLGRGLGSILGDLAALGFDAEWHCIPASTVGAPHRRDRVWIIANAGHGHEPERARPARRQGGERSSKRGESGRDGAIGSVAAQRTREADSKQRQRNGDAADDCGATLADACCDGGQQEPGHVLGEVGEAALGTRRRVQSESGNGGPTGPLLAGPIAPDHRQWTVEPDVDRVADGIPARVDRLRALGNAVVPQVVELIGRAILAAEVVS